MKSIRVFPLAGHGARRGFVLIVVMVLVISVAFAGFSFVETMSNEYRAVHINGDLLEAEQVLASAEVLLRQIIGMPREQRAIIGGVENNPEQFRDQVIAVSVEEGELEQNDPLKWRFSVVSPPANEGMNTIEVAEVSYGLGNESARFNLAQLMTIDQMSPLGGRTALMSLPGMTEIAADSILDWIDADDLPREFGAESEYYQELPNPYRPRNSLPTTLDELLLVRGVHRALLYGPDKNRNFRIDDDEQQAAQLIEQLTQTEEETQLEGQGWTDCLTLHSAERDDDRFGVPRINLNQPDLSQLHMELSEVLPAEVVEFIIHWRQYGPAPAGSASLSANNPADLSVPPQHLFTSVVDIVEAHTFATMSPTPVTIVSPVTQASHDELTLLLDHTTVHAEPVLRGRLNINMATQSVLMTIPFFTEELVDQLINRRETLDKEAMSTPAWLLSEQVLSLETFKAVLPFVTTGGDVFRAQVVAWRPIGGPYRRVECLIDGASDPVKRVGWSDLTVLGVGFSVESISGEGTESPFANEISGP
ncbi:MAG: general secretion pathway protein GspK [Planctomycetaceae bacterium]|nr:general secretion pathway protein GspK [Planctomycetaceae bacterium]